MSLSAGMAFFTSTRTMPPSFDENPLLPDTPIDIFSHLEEEELTEDPGYLYQHSGLDSESSLLVEREPEPLTREGHATVTTSKDRPARHRRPAPLQRQAGSATEASSKMTPGAWAAIPSDHNKTCEIWGYADGQSHQIATVTPGPAATAIGQVLAFAPLARHELSCTLALLERIASCPGIWDAMLTASGSTDLEQSLVTRLAYLRRAASVGSVPTTSEAERFILPDEEVLRWVPDHDEVLQPKD